MYEHVFLSRRDGLVSALECLYATVYIFLLCFVSPDLTIYCLNRGLQTLQFSLCHCTKQEQVFSAFVEYRTSRFKHISFWHKDDASNFCMHFLASHIKPFPSCSLDVHGDIFMVFWRICLLFIFHFVSTFWKRYKHLIMMIILNVSLFYRTFEIEFYQVSNGK